MTTVQLVSCPPEYADYVRHGGYWYRFKDANASALVYWRGGPHSPDHDAILMDIEAIPQRHGHGSAMLESVLVWADSKYRRLALSLICESHLADWYARYGFLRMETRYGGGVVMGRQPAALGSTVRPRLSVPYVS